MNQNEEQKDLEKPDFELTPLAPDQHAVTPVPKFTTELPFFYLTKQKRLLQQDIRYEGVDAYGNPIRWEVIPNRSSRIGVPSIEAHVIFTKLIKPVMEMHRTPDGEIPEILPLGGIRQCLRSIGWKQGGWEARGLLQGLMRIGQATCDFDFLLPVGSDANGKPTFKAIKGIFNRFSIWKIGSKHISEDELAAADFNYDFDLDDTLYIQLHRVERDIQRNQDQRYLDNQYMFAVEARARRWYELLAAKIFGVVKNRGAYCEVKYSWYIKHHHTLKRLHTRSRVVSQMNRIVGDHIASGYILKTEYRKIIDERGEIDFLIRYYPGNAAKESMTRVLSFINTSQLPILVARRRAQRRARIVADHVEFAPSIAIVDAIDAAETTDDRATADHPDDQTPLTSVVEDLRQALLSRGVLSGVAAKLVSGKTADELLLIQDHVDYWDSIRNEKRPGLLVSLIQTSSPLPTTFESSRRRQSRLASEDRNRKLARVQEVAKAEYDKRCREILDAAISDQMSPEEFEIRVAQHMEKTSSEAGFWSDRPASAEQFARHAVRAEIAKEVLLPVYDDFYLQELPRIAASLQFNPAELFMHSPESGIKAEGTAQSVPEYVPAGFSSQNGELLPSHPNSSPEAV